MSYCDFVLNAGKDSVHRSYHDKEYVFPLNDDNDLFARLVLEINQAGLSWETILKKKDNFFKAFDDFDIEKVSRYNERKIAKLLQDTGIIRNMRNGSKQYKKNSAHSKNGWTSITQKQGMNGPNYSSRLFALPVER